MSLRSLADPSRAGVLTTMGRERVATFVAVAVGIAIRLAVGDRPLDYDSANYAYVATRMDPFGAGPLDFFNNKPPGIYFWYRVVFAWFGNGPLACHLTSIIPDLVSILCLAVLGRRLVGEGVGNAAAAIYATLQPAARLAGYGYTESPLSALVLVAALVLVDEPKSAVPMWRPTVAGVIGGLATLFKQPAYLLVVGLGVWGLARTERSRRLKWGLAFAGGAVASQVALGAWLVAHQALGSFIQRTFVQGVTHGYADGFSLARRIGDWTRVVLAPMPLVVPFAALALASRARLETRGIALALVLPIVVMTIGSFEIYDHYLIPALPLVCLVLAEKLSTLRTSAAKWLAIVAMCLVQATSLVVFMADLPHQGGPLEPGLRAWRARPLTLSYQERVAKFVMDSTTPDEPILATGTEIPYLSSRRNAYRFLGVAPYLGRIDSIGFSDFPSAAQQVRILVLERWRTRLLPAWWVASLDADSSEWRRVTSLDHPEYQVYVRRTSRQPPAILDFPRSGT